MSPVPHAAVQPGGLVALPTIEDLATEQLPGDATTMLPAAGTDSRAAPLPCHPQCRACYHPATATTVDPTSAANWSRLLPTSVTTDQPGLHPTSTASSARGDKDVCATNPVEHLQCAGPAPSPRCLVDR